LVLLLLDTIEPSNRPLIFIGHPVNEAKV